MILKNHTNTTKDDNILHSIKQSPDWKQSLKTFQKHPIHINLGLSVHWILIALYVALMLAIALHPATSTARLVNKIALLSIMLAIMFALITRFESLEQTKNQPKDIIKDMYLYPLIIKLVDEHKIDLNDVLQNDSKIDNAQILKNNFLQTGALFNTKNQEFNKLVQRFYTLLPPNSNHTILMYNLRQEYLNNPKHPFMLAQIYSHNMALIYKFAKTGDLENFQCQTNDQDFQKLDFRQKQVDVVTDLYQVLNNIPAIDKKKLPQINV